MIFNSPEFLFLFLPFTVCVYYLLLRWQQTRYMTPFLFAASLFYYGYWRPENIWIIILSICLNYFLGQCIAQAGRFRKAVFIAGISANLSALVYYKYTDFILYTLNTALHINLPLQDIVLPIGISFFTFQQISYLSDIYIQRHDPTHEGFINYCCFICFFPQLVAGPIVYHQEMMPQFADEHNRAINWENIYTGLILVSMGLAKKVLIADNLSPIVHYGFDVAPSLTFLEAGFSVIAYTLQLYFDFSGYSDMAIGCALFFNIHIPQNFNSPYQACDIQDFWRRWHITLSRWLRDYLYIPLGGNRKGTGCTLGNLFITFLLGGLWHGAAWTFILWGILHGAALIIHRLWSQIYKKRLPQLVGWGLTFVFINIAWLVFRAPNFERIKIFFDAFLGGKGFYFSGVFKEQVGLVLGGGKYRFIGMCLFMFIVFISVLISKNSQYIIRYKNLLLMKVFIYIIAIFSAYFVLLPNTQSEFIYFQF